MTFDLPWKAAIRLAGSSDPNRNFTAVQQVIAQTDGLKGKTRRAPGLHRAR